MEANQKRTAAFNLKREILRRLGDGWADGGEGRPRKGCKTYGWRQGGGEQGKKGKQEGSECRLK